MEANEINSQAVMFIKRYGLGAAIDLWCGAFDLYNNDLQILNGVVCSYKDTQFLFDLVDLKRLIESHELVEKHGGLISTRKYIKFLRLSVDIGLYHGLDDVDCKTEIPLIEQAIADVESCL